MEAYGENGGSGSIGIVSAVLLQKKYTETVQIPRFSPQDVTT